MKKYLPSKKFIYLSLSFLVVGAILFVVFNVLFSKKSIFTSKKEGHLGVDRLSVLKLAQEDTDKDGVADWEEALWQTDKNNPATFDGISDAKYIENKKKELNIDQTKDEDGLTETERFAREFFSAYVAMKASGEVDADTINNFSSALGQKIAYPSIIDQYSEKDIKIDESNEGQGDSKKYYTEMKKLFDEYRSSGMGEELGLVNSGLITAATTGGEDLYNQLINISEKYKEFAKKVIQIKTPQSLAISHLKLANSSNNTGISVEDMALVARDPIVGLSGLSQYQKYSNDFIETAMDLESKALE